MKPLNRQKTIRVKVGTPRVEIDLAKIRHNTRAIADILKDRGISLMAVTKVTLGEPAVARMMIQGGASYIGESRIENIQRMADAGLNARFVLIRAPLMSQVDQVVRYASLSLNSEISTLNALSKACIRQGVSHRVVLMVELGDLREGVLPQDLNQLVQKTLTLKGIELAGIGTNLGCFSGVVPAQENMDRLSELAMDLEARFGIGLDMVSGGNSSNFPWLQATENVGRINNLRMGEMIFLGHNILTYEPVPSMYQDTFWMVGEVIEFKRKSSAPQGPVIRDAFGEKPSFEDRGSMTRAILGLGRQDVLAAGLTPEADIKIVGACSDHMVLDTQGAEARIGDEFRFRLSYGALLSAMTSPYVEKVFIGNSDHRTPQ